MTASLLHLLPLILSLLVRLDGLGATVERQPIAGSPLERDAYGLPRVGGVACWPGRAPIVFYSDSLSPEGEVHEYVHALDCADDLTLNGSPCDSKRPATYAQALAVMEPLQPGLNRWWVWYAWAGTMGPAPLEWADTEWCAIMATLTGGLTNQEAR